MQEKNAAEKKRSAKGKDKIKSKSKHRDIPYLYQTQNAYAYKAINHYLTLPRTTGNSHLSLASALFDNTRGMRRAIAFLKLLDKSETPFQKTIVLYALLSSPQGKKLKHEVAISMGFASPEEARAQLQRMIYNQLQLPAHRKLINLIDDKILPSLIKSTDSNRVYCKENYVDIIDKLNYIARSAGFLTSFKPSICIDKKSELFIALASMTDSMHSFLLIGVHDKENNKKHLLCIVGKACNNVGDCSFLDIFFQGYPAKASSESRRYYSSNLKVNYKAFSFSLERYSELLNILSQYTRPSQYHLYAYQPRNCNENSEHTSQVTMDFKKISYCDLGADEKYRAVYESLKSIKLGDTCRNSAVILLDCLLQEHYSKTGISTNFLKKPPFSASIKHGTIKEDVYVFPLLSKTIADDPLKDKILSRLYKQLEQIPQKYRDNKDTFKKFSIVKQLYMTLQDMQENHIEELFAEVHQCQREHSELIRKKRGFSFFSTTATEDMFNELNALEDKRNHTC